MSSHLETDGLVAIIETCWRNIDLPELEQSDDCRKLASAVRALVDSNRNGLQLLDVSAVDMFWMCGSEEPEFEGSKEEWKPAFLIIHSAESSRYAALWLARSIRHLPHVTTALALCIYTEEEDCNVEVRTSDLLELTSMVARRKGEAGHA